MRFIISIVIPWIVMGCSMSRKKTMVDMTLDSLLQLDAVEVVHTFGKKAILTEGNDRFILFPKSQQEILVHWNSSNDFIYSLRVDINTRGQKAVIDSLPSVWKTKSGLYLDETLEAVQELNGQAFMLTKSDNGIWISDWAQGELSDETAEVIFAVASPITDIPTRISSDEVIKREWKLQISSITIWKHEPLPDLTVDVGDPSELSEEEIQSARDDFKNAVAELPLATLPFDFLNIMGQAGVEVNCYGFPGDDFCNRYPRQDMNTLYSLVSDTSNFYAMFWSGSRFAYFADIPKLFLTTFDKNWNPIATADLHIWLASWRFTEGDCRESSTNYSAILNSDFTFMLTYSAELNCAGGDESSASNARIFGKVNPDGTIELGREGLN